MRPWDASRPARLSALAAPLVRSTSTAFSRSPAVSSSAFLQSIIPAPVRARSSATSFAGISFTVATLLTLRKNAALAPLGSEGGGRLSTETGNVRAQPSPSAPPLDSAGAGAGASSVLSRAAIASGFGRRLRRPGLFFFLPSPPPPTPPSAGEVTPSPSSAAPRQGHLSRASPRRSPTAA